MLNLDIISLSLSKKNYTYVVYSLKVYGLVQPGEHDQNHQFIHKINSRQVFFYLLVCGAFIFQSSDILLAINIY